MAEKHAISEPAISCTPPRTTPPPLTLIKMREVMPLDHTDRRTTNSCNLWDTENQ